MDQNSSQTTAKIFQFPTRTAPNIGRAVGGKAVADHAAPPFPRVEFGSGWYHEAAILADKATKP